MSYTISPEDTSWEPPPEQHASYSRRLLTVVTGAALFILGVVIGGFMTRSHTPSPAVAELGEIAGLRAKIELLTLQAAEEKVRAVELEQRLISQQVQLTQEREATSLAQKRELFLHQAIQVNRANRDLCLSELQALRGDVHGVPTDQVIRFAENVFQNQFRTLDVLACDEPSSLDASILATPLTHSFAPATQHLAGQGQSTVSQPTPTIAEVTATHTPQQGVFFSAPNRRRQGVTFITPRRVSRVASHEKSGMKFIDDTDSDAGPVFQ